MDHKEKQKILCTAKAAAYHKNRIAIAFAVLKNTF